MTWGIDTICLQYSPTRTRADNLVVPRSPSLLRCNTCVHRIVGFSMNKRTLTVEPVCIELSRSWFAIVVFPNLGIFLWPHAGWGQIRRDGNILRLFHISDWLLPPSWSFVRLGPCSPKVQPGLFPGLFIDFVMKLRSHNNICQKTDSPHWAGKSVGQHWLSFL